MNEFFRNLLHRIIPRSPRWDAETDPTIRMLREQRRAALLETRRLRRTPANIIEATMFPGEDRTP